MKELIDIEDVRGNYFSPVSIIVSIGLIGAGISVCRELITSNLSKRLFIWR